MSYCRRGISSRVAWLFVQTLPRWPFCARSLWTQQGPTLECRMPRDTTSQTVSHWLHSKFICCRSSRQLGVLCPLSGTASLSHSSHLPLPSLPGLLRSGPPSTQGLKGRLWLRCWTMEPGLPGQFWEKTGCYADPFSQ